MKNIFILFSLIFNPIITLASTDCFLYNIEVDAGPDIKSFKNISSVTACQKECQATQNCYWFVWGSWKGCYLKGNQGSTYAGIDNDNVEFLSRTNNKFISGPKYCFTNLTTTTTTLTTQNKITTKLTNKHRINWGISITPSDAANYQTKIKRSVYAINVFVTDSNINSQGKFYMFRSLATSIPNSQIYVTIEPHSGLDKITSAWITSVAPTLQKWQDLTPKPIVIRWGHEMNGNWYVWGQKPELYIKTWRLVVLTLRKLVPKLQFYWCPNVVYTKADSYGPYWPGDDVVDYVGHDIYWHGPHGTNALPSSDPSKNFWTRFNQQNFYERFAQKYNKLMVIGETGARFYPRDISGPKETNIKYEWLKQIFNPVEIAKYPLFHMIMYFEIDKPDLKNPQWIMDYRLASPNTLPMFLKFLDSPEAKNSLN